MVSYTQRPIYLCAFTKEWNNKVKPTGSIANHIFGKISNQIIIWPEKINSTTINPINFDELKKNHNIKELLILDRIIGTNKPVSIINHVNRSGQNFLRNKTPFNKLPQFPDMSKIYHKISGLDTVSVHTIGEKRFKNPLNEEVIWSELIGLIAPVAHYVGIKVFAIGGANVDNIIKLF
jgi:hypothetical protein